MDPADEGEEDVAYDQDKALKEGPWIDGPQDERNLHLGERSRGKGE